jgi:MFS-type transporter involved in bile tolerance (Atg22 family)
LNIKDAQPTWPQTLLICGFAAAFCFLGYLFSHLRYDWNGVTWLVLALMVVSGIAFLAAVFFYYLRPQYGAKALLMFILMLVGHALLVLVLVKAGIAK